jgi:hypothetical protein
MPPSQPQYIKVKRPADEPPLSVLLCEEGGETPILYQLANNDDGDGNDGDQVELQTCLKRVESSKRARVEAIPFRPSLSTTTLESGTEDGYVYDYYRQRDSVPTDFDMTSVSVVKINELVFASDEESEWCADDDGDEDSNAEDNPCNDYPDEESSDDHKVYYRWNTSDNDDYDYQ